MNEIEQPLQDAVRLGYKAAENGENLEDIINSISVQDEAETR